MGNERADAVRDGRTLLSRSRHEQGRGEIIFPVQLATIRIDRISVESGGTIHEHTTVVDPCWGDEVVWSNMESMEVVHSFPV